MILLRDFEDTDTELKELFTGQGFIKIAMPETCIIDNTKNWKTSEEFVNTLSPVSRRHLRQDVIRFESLFEVEVKDNPTKDELNNYIKLFRNVKSRNFDINTFDYPVKFFETMANSKNWEFILLKQNKTLADDKIEGIMAVIFCYKNANNDYNPIFLGMNYDFLDKYNTYRQAIFQAIKRANELGSDKIYLGLSATIEKKKFGARIVPKVAYVQAKDNFNMEFIETMSVKSIN
jgi:Acetyltransferase (GNAT) domain